jgi:1,4-dihydroxy-2-naphthoate polyprenyltransferase
MFMSESHAATQTKTFTSTVKDWFMATRPWSFALSLVSVSVGTLIAAETGPILWGWYVLACVGIICFHGTANVLNDYFDTHYHVDQSDSPTAKYRPHPLLSGAFTPRQLLVEGIVLMTATIIIGLILSYARSGLVFWTGLIGFLASVFYTAGPVKYKYRGFGEFFVFLMWGPFMVEGAYAVQRQALSGKALLISIPFGVLVAMVLMANNIRDIAYDSRQPIKTISMILGREKSIRLYAGFILAAYVFVTGMVILHVVSPWALLVFISLPKAISLVKTFMKQVPDAADAITGQFNTAFGVLFIAALIIQIVFK